MYLCKDTNYKNILNDRPSEEEFQKNCFKPWREAWMVAKVCQKYTADSALITAPYIEPADVLLKIGEQEVKFQCVECKNKGPRGSPEDHPYLSHENGSREYLNIGWTHNYINVCDEIFKKVENKNLRYSEVDKNNLILLVYLNIYGSTEEDLDLENLKKKN